ncbi:MAG TPA: oligosaccharide flippase family protein [Pyrinomonadaceae bacterium]|jgi:O-antigen/teichoic acid export membrane protein|nr:oligosaccharide flippase family protein [Pyrinomonadaceae bacterium]
MKETLTERAGFTARGRHLFGGAAHIFASEALLVPVGLLTAAYLSRRFGPEGYGLLTLAFAPVVLLESNVATALSRPAIKLVGGAGGDWKGVGAAVLRLYLLAGCALALALLCAAAPLSRLMSEPALEGYLRVLALDVPVFCAAQAHRNIIVGLGLFRQRALASAARWTTRLLLVVVFVYLTGSPAGALWGTVCASLAELAVCRLYVRPALFPRESYPLRSLCGYAMPLVASALCLSLHGRLDLVMLKSLGASAAEAGVYGVAQNLALLPTLFSYAFAPALLSTLARALREGDDEGARTLARLALRAVVLLLPVAAMTAGAATEIVGFIFGREFVESGALLRPLIFGSLALLVVSVSASVLAAAGRERWTLHVAWPTLACAALGHALVIPYAGAWGAAVVTALTACACASVSLALVWRAWRVAPPGRTLLSGAAVAACAYALTALVPSAGPLLALKLACVCALSAAALALLGEFGARTPLRPLPA